MPHEQWGSRYGFVLATIGAVWLWLVRTLVPLIILGILLQSAGSL